MQSIYGSRPYSLNAGHGRNGQYAIAKRQKHPLRYKSPGADVRQVPGDTGFSICCLRFCIGIDRN
jgi:hypothetical protein